MDLIDARHWKILSKRGLQGLGIEELITQSLPLIEFPDQEYRLHLLLDAGMLNPSQREQLVSDVGANWPTVDDKHELDRTLYCVRVLDLLGRSDLVDQRQANIHDVLFRHWEPPGDAKFSRVIGRFTSEPRRYRSPGRDDKSLEGVELLARVGVPNGIDLRLVRAYLRQQCREALWFAIADSLEAQDVPNWSALLRLERTVSVPSRSWLAAIFDERLVICTTLIVALCFVAIRMAEPSQSYMRSLARVGAQP